MKEIRRIDHDTTSHLPVPNNHHQFLARQTLDSDGIPNNRDGSQEYRVLLGVDDGGAGRCVVPSASGTSSHGIRKRHWTKHGKGSKATIALDAQSVVLNDPFCAQLTERMFGLDFLDRAFAIAQILDLGGTRGPGGSLDRESDDVSSRDGYASEILVVGGKPLMPSYRQKKR